MKQHSPEHRDPASPWSETDGFHAALLPGKTYALEHVNDLQVFYKYIRALKFNKNIAIGHKSKL